MLCNFVKDNAPELKVILFILKINLIATGNLLTSGVSEEAVQPARAVFNQIEAFTL